MNLIEFGDCRDTMRRWAADGVKAQMCVTSPPYFGLRDYGHDGQIGLEPTPEAYIAEMVEVFRCVRDVLAGDGTVWLNIGDSYASFRDGKATPDTTRGDDTGTLVPKGSAKNRMASTFRDSGIKHKDLIGIPWMLAFALRADGWYLRQDIIWHKPNPMPESVRDRCTKAHEYIFLLSKSEKYFFDSELIREPCSEDMQRRAAKGYTRGATGKVDASRQDANTLRGEHAKAIEVANGRNRRSVWTVATRPYKGAHFATFPPALIEPCILAGSRPNDVVLDPFMGSGTTAMVALQYGRRYLGCELNRDYESLQTERLIGIQQALA
jgi:DNA modification methylase